MWSRLVGGGGKSSAMFRLGEELSQAGRRVLMATTTRIFVTQINLAPAFVWFDPRIPIPCPTFCPSWNA